MRGRSLEVSQSLVTAYLRKGIASGATAYDGQALSLLNPRRAGGGVRLPTLRRGLCLGVGSAAPAAARKALRRTSIAMPCAGRCRYTTRANRPSVLAVVVALPATGRGYHHPSALGGHEITTKLIREVIATRVGHPLVVPGSPDTDSVPRDCSDDGPT